MSELAELERRINDALERIGSGLERIDAADAAAAGDGEDLEALREALQDEKTANAQLEERIKSLRRKDEARIKELEDEIGDLKAAASETGAQITQLRTDNQSLTSQVEAAQADLANAPDSVALQQELERLRKLRAADRAELDAIIRELAPLMEETENA